MHPIDLSEAQSRRWDVLVAGSSFAAVFFAHRLPPELNVLFVEKGTFNSHAAQVQSGWPWPSKENIAQRNSTPHAKHWVAYTTFGGNSNYWWGDSPRLHPDDFRTRSRFGIAEDWPLTYDELEPYYVEAEYLMETSGGGTEHILPRSRPFPFPAHAPSRSDERLRAHHPLWVPLPTGRANGGSRGYCCVNGVCSNCPIDVKFTILNSLDRLQHPNARYLLGTEVRALDIAAGRAEAAIVRDAAGRDVRIAADAVALGANGIFNAAILMRSGVDSPALGRYLHEQAPMDVVVDTARMGNFFGGTSETGHGHHFYHGADRASAAAVLIENINAPHVIRPEAGKWTNRLHLRLLAEDIPRAENRVVLEDDEPVVEWNGHHDYAFRGLERALEGLPGIIPDDIDAIEAGDLVPTEAHIQGTHRMGPDASGAVVDGHMRVHGVGNLFALGSGSWPSCSPANPTLTIAATSLRAAEALG